MIIAFKPYDDSVYNYRMQRPLEPLKAKFRRGLLRKNEQITLGDLAKRIKKQGNVYVVKNITNLETARWLVALRDLNKAKLVMDFDDYFFKIPDLNSAMLSYNKESIQVMAALTGRADYLTVSTVPLKYYLSDLNNNIEVLPNLIDPDDWIEPTKHDKIRVGWIYNTMHLPDAELIGKALHKVRKRYKDKVEICLFGGKVNPFLFDLDVHQEPVKNEDYPKALCEMGLDISLAPLLKNPYNDCKSNCKWLESTMAGSAVIASKVAPYKDSIKNKVTGLLADSEKQWYNKICLLIEDEKYRKQLAKNAKKEVLKNYNVKKDDKWRKFYQSI